MDIEKRDEQIYKLREKGATFSHISSLFNISTTRVTQLYYRTRYKKEHYDTWPPLMKMLSTRSKNALTNYFRNENILDNLHNGIFRAKIIVLRRWGSWVTDFPRPRTNPKLPLENMVTGLAEIELDDCNSPRYTIL